MLFVDEKYINRERSRAFKPLSINQYLDKKIEDKQKQKQKKKKFQILEHKKKQRKM